MKNFNLPAKGRFKLSVPFSFIFVLGILLFAAGCNKFEDLLDYNAKLQGVDLKLVADNFVSPLGVVAAPDESDKLYVIDQIGKIWVLDAAGSRLPVPFLDVSTKIVPLSPNYDERGLLGFAFAGVTGWLGGELVDRLSVGVDEGAHLDAPSSLSGRPASGHTRVAASK